MVAVEIRCIPGYKNDPSGPEAGGTISGNGGGCIKPMWPYCKNKWYEEGMTKCPVCGLPSKGYFDDDGLVMAFVCRRCKEKGSSILNVTGNEQHSANVKCADIVE